jgi:hypothetical protein
VTNNFTLKLQIPKTEAEWKVIAKGFNDQWNFPNCLAAVDAKHVSIKKPPHTGSYYNYKKIFSILLIAVANSNYEFIMADAGINGRISEGGVLANTTFGKAFVDKLLQIPEPDTLPNSEKELPFVFVGDDAFALTENFMKPYGQTGITVEQQIFNYRLSHARRVVKNSFGILVSRFGVLQRHIALSPQKAQPIVLTCCSLHNYLLRNQAQTYISRGSVVIEDFGLGNITNGTCRTSGQSTSLQISHSSNSPASAKAVRDSYRDFLNNEGQVSWQHKFA